LGLSDAQLRIQPAACFGQLEFVDVGTGSLNEKMYDEVMNRRERWFVALIFGSRLSLHAMPMATYVRG